jgi:uncharacterized membrane protein
MVRSLSSVLRSVSASALAFAALLATGSAVLLATADTATAQARVEERLGFAVTGDVKAIDAAAKTITIKSTNDDGVVYAVDPTATLMRGGQTIPLSDVQVGWNVAVNGQEARDGARTITMLKVTKAP